MSQAAISGVSVVITLRNAQGEISELFGRFEDRYNKILKWGVSFFNRQLLAEDERCGVIVLVGWQAAGGIVS